MAGCEPLVRALLLADPAVSAAVGGSRIYPLIRPQGSALPAITYQRVSRIRVDPFSRADPLVADARVQNARLQIDCWAATYGDVKELAADVLNVLAGYVGAAPAARPARDLGAPRRARPL